MNKDRKIIAHTGRLGAINYLEAIEIEFFKMINKREPSDEEINNLKAKVQGIHLEEGMYKISEDGLKYLGKYE